MQSAPQHSSYPYYITTSFEGVVGKKTKIFVTFYLVALYIWIMLWVNLSKVKTHVKALKNFVYCLDFLNLFLYILLVLK